MVTQFTAGDRYLSGDISYFGVGSKNAAFYLGRAVKVVTKPCDSTYVHELSIQGKGHIHDKAAMPPNTEVWSAIASNCSSSVNTLLHAAAVQAAVAAQCWQFASALGYMQIVNP
jgi:hypothetical protein